MSDTNPWSKHIADESRPLLERIGAIGLLFSALERSLDDHYLLHAAGNRLDYDIVSRTFLQLPRAQKNIEIVHLFERYYGEAPVVSVINNLIDCFSWCEICRNNILHSEIYPTTHGPKNVITISKRVRRTSKLNYTKLDEGTADRVANFIHSCWMQSAEIEIYLRYREKKEQLPDELMHLAEKLPENLKKPKMLKTAAYPYLLDI